MFGKKYKIFHWLRGGSLVLTFVAVFVVAESVLAISSTNYEIDPSGTDGVFHVSTSTSFRLEGAIEPINGLSTSTTYKVESGSSFAGLCGDGFIDPTEDCEGSNLNGATCASVRGAGYTGTLSCSSSCTFVTSGCSAPTPSGGGGGGGGGIILSSPTFDPAVLKKTFTYQSSYLIYGYKPIDALNVYVNKSTAGVTYPTTSRWSTKVSLPYGLSTIEIYAANASLKSSTNYYKITRRRIGDINLDDRVDDYDFSLLASHWGQNWAEADFNGDNRVDDYDLSLLVAYWTN